MSFTRTSEPACGNLRHQRPKHISLLFTTLSNLSLKSINAAFEQQGIKVEGLELPADPKDDKNPYTYHSALRLDGMRMPSPFHERVLNEIMKGNSDSLPEGIIFGQHGHSTLRPTKLNKKTIQTDDYLCYSVYKGLAHGMRIYRLTRCILWTQISSVGKTYSTWARQWSAIILYPLFFIF